MQPLPALPQPSAGSGSHDPASKRALRTAVLQEVRDLWALSWPILVGQLATLGMAVTDVAMAGHASAQDLAGVALGVAIWNIIMITLIGLMLSVAPLVAHHVGAREYAPIAHVVRQGLWKALGMGLAAWLLANLSAQVFYAMNLEPSVRLVAVRFVHVISFALPAFACYRVFYAYSASLDQTKPMMVIALISLLLNALVNWLLVFGHAGLPALGGVGCAWASLLCIWFSALALFAWTRFAPAYRSTWPLARFEPPHWETLRRLLRLGLPIGVAYFAETTAFALIALLIARFGSTQVAAHAIALNFTSLVFMVPLSLGMGLLTRIGQSLGAGAPEVARFRAWTGVALAALFALCAGLGIALARELIASAYTNDADVTALAARLLLLAALFQLSDCTQVVISNAMRAYKVTRAPMLLHLGAFWGLSLPLGCVLGLAPAWLSFAPAQALAAQGFWIALTLGLSVAAAGLALLLRHVANAHVRSHASA